MLIDIQKFHMSSDEHFGSDMSSDQHSGSDMSSDGLKALTLGLVMDQVKPMIMNEYQMGCEGCKKQPYLCYINLAIMMPLKL